MADTAIQAHNYLYNKIKQLDYLFYLSFLTNDNKEAIATIYNFHLELSQIPITSKNEEARQIRSNWWLNTITNINSTNKTTNHPLLSAIIENFRYNNEVLSKFKELIVLRFNENESHGFKTEKQLYEYIGKTNHVIWCLIYQMYNQCQLTQNKQELMMGFSFGIKLCNILESLYYRSYNNHFFISNELIETLQNHPNKNRQQQLFDLIYKAADLKLSNFIKLADSNEDLAAFLTYAKLNKSRLHLLSKVYSQNTDNKPPAVNKFTAFLKAKLIY